MYKNGIRLRHSGKSSLSNHFIENINIFLEMRTHRPNALIHIPLV